jgi:hypothetical protein
MRTRNRVCFVVAAMIIAATGEICFASSDGSLQYWGTTGASFDINKEWKFAVEEEFRLGDDADELFYHHTDMGFIYSGLADWIDLGFNYRQVFQKDSTGEWRQENLPHLNVTFKGKLFGLDISDRSRMEFRDRENVKDVWRYRNKLTVKLPFELTKLKLRPYLADEAFITLNDDNIDKNRFFAGFSVKLSKSIDGEVYYMFESSRSNEQWDHANVLGTAIKLRF